MNRQLNLTCYDIKLANEPFHVKNDSHDYKQNPFWRFMHVSPILQLFHKRWNSHDLNV